METDPRIDELHGSKLMIDEFGAWPLEDCWSHSFLLSVTEKFSLLSWLRKKQFGGRAQVRKLMVVKFFNDNNAHWRYCS